MATIARFTVPADAFPLGTIFEDVPEASMELDRIVPTRGTVVPYVWVRNGNDIEAVVREHADFTAMQKIEALDDLVLYRVDWGPDEGGLLDCIVETGVSLLNGDGTKEEWVFEIRADTPTAVAEFRRCCQNRDIPVTLSRLQTLAKANGEGQYGLTPAQREALELTFREGYYEDPSKANLEELAAQLDISRPSLSARLKRGYRNLIASTIIHGERESK